jgi:hypothetical protein
MGFAVTIHGKRNPRFGFAIMKEFPLLVGRDFLNDGESFLLLLCFGLSWLSAAHTCVLS